MLVDSAGGGRQGDTPALIVTLPTAAIASGRGGTSLSPSEGRGNREETTPFAGAQGRATLLAVGKVTIKATHTTHANYPKADGQLPLAVTGLGTFGRRWGSYSTYKCFCRVISGKISVSRDFSNRGVST